MAEQRGRNARVIRFAVTLFSTILACGVSIVLGFVVWQNPHRGQTLISILSIIVSWPVIIGALGFSAGITFRKELSGFLDRIYRVEYPGGAIEARQPQPPDENKEDTTAKRKLVQEQAEEMLEQSQRKIEKLTQKIVDKIEQERDANARLSEELKKALGDAVQWQFRFFDEFFIEATKYVVTKLVEHGDTALGELGFNQLFPGTYAPIINDSWKGIVRALMYYDIVSVDKQHIKLTELGKAYGEYLRKSWKPSERRLSSWSKNVMTLNIPRSWPPDGEIQSQPRGT